MTADVLIDGQLAAGGGDAFDVVDPATGEGYATVRSASEGQVDEAVVTARRTQPAWWGAAQSDRSRALHRFADAVRTGRQDIATVATHETGRPLTRNLLYVDMLADIFDQYAELARVLGGRIAPANEPGQLSLVPRVPYGVVAALVPWNYPLLLLAFKVAPALAAGNTVVIKPASATSRTTLLLGELFAEHLPAGVAGIVTGPGGTVGEWLVGHPGVDLVAFTGSTEVGRHIGAVCAERTTATHLELGGKDPAIVFEDADPALAAQAVSWAAFLNAGQVCTSTERVYVHRSVFDRFVDRSVDVAGRIRVGDPFDSATDVGPMRSASGRQKVLAQVAAAEEAGAKVLAGGDALDGPGFFLAPTVVVDVDHSMEIMREETFGPVMPIMPFDDDDEAFRLAADTPYGLGASLYTHDPDRVRRAYETLDVGMVWVNDPVVDNLAAPFGGTRASGTARELGLEGLEAFTLAKHVHWNTRLEHKPWWYGGEEET